MSLISFKIHISEKAGEISCESMEIDAPKAILILAHGAGAGMHHPFMTQLTAELAAVNISAVRFQFPYMEQGKKRPDAPEVAHETIRQVIIASQKKYPSLPLYVGGKSFGGRMASQLIASEFISDVKGLVFYGFPLHPTGKSSTNRADHLQHIKIPMLFLQGSRDKLATPELIGQVTKQLPQTTLTVLEGADHSFHVLKKSGITDDDMIKMLASSTAVWIERQEEK